jgi:hypothetical protein
MPYDRDGNVLWIADETGAHEILEPGGGFNGRTREPGEPDWWVVAKKPDWRPPTFSLNATPEDGDPGSGSGEWSGSGKLAGADPEAGRPVAPAEPWSVLSATQEHLDHIDKIKGFGDAVSTIGKGVGEAVDKGIDGAGEALGKTWDALTTNEDLHKGVEFGGKAAWEVSKDVWERAGEDAAGALVGAGSYYKLGETAGKVARGTVFDLFKNGGQDYMEWPDKARDLGERINKVKERVYGKP